MADLQPAFGRATLSLGELLVAESIAWEQSVYSLAERARINATAHQDQRNRWRALMDAAISAALRGDPVAAAEGMAQYRLVTMTVAMECGLPEHRFHDAPSEYPRREA